MKLKKFLFSQKAAPYVFVLPFILSFCIFWVYPLFSTVKMSFQSILPGQIEWIGLENYTKLLRDTAFHTAIKNSFTYMILSLVLLIPFPMLFAEMPTGQMNQILQFFGSDAIPWLKNRTTAMFALILLCCWRWTGVNMLYFMSGLKGIDASLYEAADIDGANSWKNSGM